jgi:hypothetical protein
MGIKNSEFYADFKFIDAACQICPLKSYKITMKKCEKKTKILKICIVF